MKFWHARFGPSVPQEMIDHLMRYTEANSYTEDLEKMYPEKLYVRSAMKYVEVETKTAFCFGVIRKLLIESWEISNSGPSIDFEKSEGTLKKPLDISSLGIPLTDFKLLNLILSEHDHMSVKNLTAQKVNCLDELANKLRLDIHRYLYIGRTRIGDQTGHQIQATFFGTNLEIKHARVKYELTPCLNKNISFDFDGMQF